MTNTTAPVVVANATHLVTFAASPARYTPARLREACEARGADAFAALLPSTVTAVAALGLAIRVAVEADHRWVHVGQAEGRSRWIYCASKVSEAEARITGQAGAEASNATGDLTIDADVPTVVANKLRAAYDEARGVVDPARVNGAVTRLALRANGRQLMTGVVMLPALTNDVVAALRVVSDLGGVGLEHALDDVAAQRLAQPLQRSLTDHVDDLVARVEDLAKRARACAADEKATLRDPENSAEGLRAQLDDARAQLALWRDRLGLVTASAEAALGLAETAMDDAVDVALKALKARRAKRQ